jgi:predicted nucleic acid-binding protein
VILADTSVWVGHFRSGSDDLKLALENGQVLCHPHVVGELACGTLRNRDSILEFLRALPQAATATDDEVLACIERNRLYSTGLGYTDVHLLASAMLTPTRLWTLEGALGREAKRLRVAGGRVMRRRGAVRSEREEGDDSP